MQELSSCYKDDTSSPYILSKFVHVGPFIITCTQTSGEDSPLWACSQEIATEDRLSHDENCVSGASLTLKIAFCITRIANLKIQPNIAFLQLT